MTRILWLTLLLVGLAAVFNSFKTPLFEPPDELQHYQFVRHLADAETLPIQETNGPVSQSHQPPLYYLGGAFLVAGLADPQTMPQRNPFWAALKAGEVSNDNKLQFLNSPVYAFPYQGTALVMHILRLWSVMPALLGVVVMWQIGRLLWPDDPAKVTLMLAIGALNPMFLYMAGSVNNDNMVFLWGACMLLLALIALRNGFRWPTTVAIGVVSGLALLSKLNGLVLLLTWGTTLLWIAWHSRNLWLLFSRGVVIVGLTAVIAGWWFWRNIQLYGDPTALQTNLNAWGARSAEQMNWQHLWADAQYGWSNFWGRFGYGQIPLPDAIYAFYLLLCLLALAGSGWLLLGYVVRRKPINPDWLVISVTFIGYLGALFYYMLRSATGANGRYLFPALPAIAALFVQTVSVWFNKSHRPERLYWGLTAVLVSMTAYICLFYLPWVYAPPPRYTDVAEPDISRPTELAYPGLATLLGYDLEPETAVPGQTIAITLYWQVTDETDENYPLFVQLVDSNGQRIAGRDTHAGLGRYPTSRWQTGEIIADTIPLSIPATTSGPTGVVLTMGLRDEYGRLLSTDNTQTTITLGVIRLGTGVLAADVPALYHLGEVVDLVEIVPPEDTAVPGALLPFQLTWRARQNPAHDYSVFIHLLDANSQLVETYDQPPQAGAFPTSLWLPGDVVSDERQIQLPANLPPGTYTVVAGWYRLDDFSRLPVMDTAGQSVADGAIPLFTLEIGD